MTCCVGCKYLLLELIHTTESVQTGEQIIIMDTLAKNLFSEFDGGATSGLPRPHFPTNNFMSSPLCSNPEGGTPSLVRELSSPKSSDSFMDEMENLYEFMSPTNSPIKQISSPSNEPGIFTCSPPCLNKGLLNLRLFDTPHTPKSLFTRLKKASVEDNNSNIMKSPASVKNRKSLREKFMKKELQQQDRKRPQTAPRPEKNYVYANFNPFTPNSELQMKAKRARIQLSR